jgi:hypothetical protein
MKAKARGGRAESDLAGAAAEFDCQVWNGVH